MVRAKELMVAASSDTMSDQNRATIAAELAGIAEDIATLIDTRHSRGALLFSPGAAHEIPVNACLLVAPVASRADTFLRINTTRGAMNLQVIIRPPTPTH